jgi:hypothetical protein
MIKLKQLLFESTAPDIFIPRRVEDRVERYIKDYIRNGSQGDLRINQLDLIELPAILKNVTVNGDFVCEMNQLTSLKNSPKYVSNDFLCNDNMITSLVGAPTNVVGRFDCSNNNLTSLEGAPKTVGDNFFCGFNDVKFTEEQVRAVCNVKGDIYGVL